MPLNAAPIYILERYKRDAMAEALEKQQQELLEYKFKLDSFIADMLWAAGSGKQFSDYPRWHEVIASTNEVDKNGNEPKLTKEIMKEHIRSLRKMTQN